MNIENQIVEIKGDGHPDELTDILSEVAVNAVHEHDPNLYVNLNNCYLKAKRFPEFIVGGQMSFDFNEYSKEDRYELENFVRSKIIDKFKEYFPEAIINVSFNISLFPDENEYFIFNEMYNETTYVSAFFPFTEKEKLVKEIDNYLYNVKYVGSDYRVVMFPSKTVIEVCFFQEKSSLRVQLTDDLEDVFPELEELHVNPRDQYTGVTHNRFGSRLFINKSGISGRGNDLYGFRSPQRISNNRNINGMDNRSADKNLFEKAQTTAQRYYNKNDKPITVTAYCVGSGEKGEDVSYISK